MIRELKIRTSARNELIDISRHVADSIRDINEGTVTVFVPHTTAGITINENADPDVRADILKKLSSLIPERDNYRHSEGNSDAHLKASLMGSSVTVIVKDGKPLTGTWQGIYFCEFDGPRDRKIIIRS
ncbi:MAG: secondary thiamine-phosphate synthase enzyme YjbQ [archaeon]